MQRIYYVTHPETGQTVFVREGVCGFFETMVQDPDEIARRHANQGITPEMAQAAIGASMFGWEAPIGAKARGEA